MRSRLAPRFSRHLSRLLVALILAGGLQLGPGGAGQVQAASGPAAQLLEGVNQVRLQNGLPALVEEGRLDALAGERSADMAVRRYFSHVTPEGRTVFNLMDQSGIAYSVAGENVAWNTGNDRSASGIALQSFLNSPPHRDNLFSWDFSQVGVGVASEGGRTYFTLLFLG
jgi:uncharacterized protein YkwD